MTGNQRGKWLFVAMFTWLFMWSGMVQAQTAKYLVLLKDKTGTPFTTDKPTAYLSQRSVDRRSRQGIALTSRDLPVNPSYVSQIRQTGAKVWYTSRWLNAVLVEATSVQLTAIRALSFVAGTEFNRALSNARLSAEKQTTATQQKFGMDAYNYGASLSQIQMLGADAMHDQGYNGKGMLVAILDAGFLNSNTNPALSTLFSDKRVVVTYDFVKNETSVYEDHSHGNNVFSIMASFKEGSLIGPAYGASYALLRTEDDNSESRLEEATWLIAAEYADSLGTDVINTSLGYNQFDNEADDYTYADMNGKTTLITRAADWASATGMIVVASAGNEGASAWKYISAPADADAVLAVGAVGSTKALASFSSIGPSADGRVKPDVCAQGFSTVLSNQAGNVTAGNGTSYSAPLIAGLVAAFWQSQPQLTAMQVVDCIRRAGDRFASPTPQYGYGIPTFAAATEVARAKYLPMGVGGNKPTEAIVFPNPVGNANALQIQWGAEFTGKKVEVALTDVAGRVWLQQSVMANEPSSKLTLPTAMPQGSYVLKMNDNERVRVLKVIK
ncbi:MAG TPA: peptidase S8 [Runella sp.]|nr:peptidase S8 [Runella sp.]